MYGNNPIILLVAMIIKVDIDNKIISLWWVIFLNSSLIFVSIFNFIIDHREFNIQKFIGKIISADNRDNQFNCNFIVIGSNGENSLVIIFS